MQAKARDFHAAEDREKARPPFPRVGEDQEDYKKALATMVTKGKKGEQPPVEKRVLETTAIKSDIDETVIVDFIDEMDEALPAFQPSLLPEDMGLTLAESAAGEAFLSTVRDIYSVLSETFTEYCQRHLLSTVRDIYSVLSETFTEYC
jgi:hypothetical protein